MDACIHSVFKWFSSSVSIHIVALMCCRCGFFVVCTPVYFGGQCHEICSASLFVRRKYTESATRQLSKASNHAFRNQEANARPTACITGSAQIDYCHRVLELSQVLVIVTDRNSISLI
jgi:hypothetical protein